MERIRQTLWATVLVASAVAFMTTSPLAADFVINDDLIVDGSACIGFDCINGETFGFDTIKVKENNLRIKFDDTSVAASFPRNDWQLTANDSANGGASKFSIDDISGSRTPFTVEANARSHSLYVDDGGRIGSRTSTPSVEIHTIDGDTPTLRLQQDGSSGFAPQTWDLAGNETNFFVRDVTNGSALPFRIRPGAPTSSIFIDVDGDIGAGTASPDSNIHSIGGVLIDDADNGAPADPALLYVRDYSAESNTVLAHLEQETGAPIARFESQFRTWDFTGGNSFTMNDPSDGVVEMTLNSDGDLTIEGDFFSTTCSTPCAPDYVFEPDYDLKTLDEVASFIEENKHLPNVPSAEELVGPINMSQMQMTLLEKIEELTLYTIGQEEKLASQTALIEALNARLEALEGSVN